jgi:putative DNA primase/helicase
VLPEVFRGEVCAGFDYRAVCRVLAQRGHLELGPHNRFDRRERLPGIGPSLCYRIKASIFSEN